MTVDETFCEGSSVVVYRPEDDLVVEGFDIPSRVLFPSIDGRVHGRIRPGPPPLQRRIGPARECCARCLGLQQR